MLYHFEIRSERGWEAFGSGEGSGEVPAVEALEDPRSLAGGTLPEGGYRCIAATSDSPRWETLQVLGDGRIAAWEEGDLPGASST